MKAKVIVIANRKGGCGKTTTSKNIAFDLAEVGKKILLVDLDPQCNATDGLTNRQFKKTILSVLRGENIGRCIFKTRFSNLDIIPGNDYLASEEIESGIVKKQLEVIKNEYDYIIIDTSPYFNKLTAEIMLEHDLVIIPTEVLEDSIKGMVTTINELSYLCENNMNFKILYTKVDNTKSTEKDLKELFTQFKNISFNTVIHSNHIPVKRARQRKIPLSKRYKLSRVAKDYEMLVKEILNIQEEQTHG